MLLKNKLLLGGGLAVSAGFMWGTLGVITVELINLGLDAFQISFIRMGGAFLICLLVGLYRQQFRLINIRQFFFLILVGLICQALSSYAFSQSVSKIGGNITIALMCTGPIFTLFLNRILFAEVLQIKSVLSVLVAILGLLFLVISNDISMNHKNLVNIWIGLIFGIISGFCYGLFPILARYLESVSPFIIVSYSCGFAALILLPAQSNLVINQHLSLALIFWGALLIFIPTIIADLFYVKAIHLSGTLIASLFALVEVPAATIYAVMIQSTHINLIQILGIGIFCIGLSGLIINKNLTN
ncbi:DMT family transporter [Arsenophonus nasoniae]|uniref:DMT family transporter n=1 Tax=Arsenophonus nasoniae TaxID=638 RepID=A0AA95K388_9GAMM|nr:DMT family transporter [Arsenophonus nasoniae]WGL94755.1 DMT family transporter [Arsenophonus nasoniae]